MAKDVTWGDDYMAVRSLYMGDSIDRTKLPKSCSNMKEMKLLREMKSMAPSQGLGQTRLDQASPALIPCWEKEVRAELKTMDKYTIVGKQW